MSDDILSVATPFPDVASLAQGYINRVDGERLLVPLEAECSEGSGIRFVIYLGDGTAAFAGAGRCAQVSDQGGSVPPQQRFETLIDSLDLDERSRPVYDYIVAVRNAAYGQEPAAEASSDDEVSADIEEPIVAATGEAGEAQLEPQAESMEEASFESSLEATVDIESHDVESHDVKSGIASAQEPAAFGELIPSDSEPAAFAELAMHGDHADEGSLEELPEELSEEAAAAVTAYASTRPDVSAAMYSPVPAAPSSVPPFSVPPSAMPGIPGSFRPEATSFIPPALPTGILQRPARALHWQPAPPRRPTPLPQTGLFRYSGPGLPAPTAAPRPDLDPVRLVRRAPRP